MGAVSTSLAPRYPEANSGQIPRLQVERTSRRRRDIWPQCPNGHLAVDAVRTAGRSSRSSA
ncbi:MAG: hypothetical protein GXX95_01305 [Methanomassiliicoccus sp.]|nr:hypothetical protein [Methanomassiliicoccus sp.]